MTKPRKQYHTRQMNTYNQKRTAGPRWRQGKTYSPNGERECKRRRAHASRTGRYDNGQLV